MDEGVFLIDKLMDLFKSRVKIFIMYLISKMMRIQKKIVFISFGGRQYSDNPRWISEKMHELYPEYKQIWILNKFNDNYKIMPEYVEIIDAIQKIRALKELSTAFCVISNTEFYDTYYKRKEQYYIDTWHGSNPLKKILYDVIPKDEWTVKIADNKLVDLMVTNSNFGSNLYRSAMEYFGKVIEEGLPRNDILVKNDSVIIEMVKRRLNIGIKSKILLYAPTFRDDLLGEQDVLVDLHRIIGLLNDNEDWICLLRAHPGAKGLKCLSDDFIMDVSDYPDMAELLLITDLLITDYSSCASDFILRDKPVIMAQFDYEDYKKNCRDFYYEMDKLPFFIAHTQCELEKIILGLTDEKVKDNCDKIRAFYQIKETGESAEKICKIINDEYYKRIVKTR